MYSNSIRIRRFAEWAIQPEVSRTSKFFFECRKILLADFGEKMEEVRRQGVFLRGLGLSTIAFDSGSQSITEVGR